MSNDDEFGFLPPAEAPPSFNQEKDHFHEEVEAEDFGMVEDFGLQMEYSDEDLLPENTAPSSLNVGFVGVGGGGNKMANAMIELGFNKDPVGQQHRQGHSKECRRRTRRSYSLTS